VSYVSDGWRVSKIEETGASLLSCVTFVRSRTPETGVVLYETLTLMVTPDEMPRFGTRWALTLEESA
jgi:hypothetical protein